MSTKAQVLAQLKRIPDGEPLFLLRGRDEVASVTVAFWSHAAKSAGSPAEKVSEAMGCSLAMATWPTKKVPD